MQRTYFADKVQWTKGRPFWSTLAGTVFLFMLVAILVVLAAAAIFAGPPAEAQIAAGSSVVNPNIRTFGATVNACCTGAGGSNYTNATTSYTAVTGLGVTGTTIKDPSILNSYNGPYVSEALHVWWSVNVGKATATTATCALALNGNVLAFTAQTFNVGGAQGILSGVADLNYASGFALSSYSADWNVGTTGETQTVAVYCKSGDTNTLTVYNGDLLVEEHWA
jgi:hypothetical protein